MVTYWQLAEIDPVQSLVWYLALRLVGHDTSVGFTVVLREGPCARVCCGAVTVQRELPCMSVYRIKLFQGPGQL